MIKKLIILILFLAITVLAIGFVTLPNFGMATQFKMGEKAVELADAKQATVIDIPIAGAFMGGDVQAVIAFDDAAGYTEFLQNKDGAVMNYTQADAIAAGATYIPGAAVLMWLFFLVMIILLPRKHGKKKIKKLAKEVAYEVVDEEMDNMPPARYAPAPRRRDDGPRGEGRRRRDDYDDDYDY